MNFESVAASLLFLITVCGAIYGMMKFMLKDITAAVSLMDKHVNELRTDLKETNTRMDKLWCEANNRMDGVYHVLLKWIKEE
jgi:uncharacterized protein Yka (UPF0111/DUF47 family)